MLAIRAALTARTTTKSDTPGQANRIEAPMEFTALREIERMGSAPFCNRIVHLSEHWHTNYQSRRECQKFPTLLSKESRQQAICKTRDGMIVA